MPRLLLVDDNPSIHKIAETLLAPTSIQLVCVESAAEALKKIEAGEAFDVALVDIAMAGMDGWELLACLRAHPATVTMPIAMMAGVLDSVDPQRLADAPIQGFLKKPVELRDLGDRVRKLLETPVALPPPPPPPAPVVEPPPVPVLPPEAPHAEAHSAFATMPATRLSDLPEFRAAAAPREEDLLELGEEDLLEVSDSPSGLGSDLFEPVEPEVEDLNVEEPLDLEEFDLDGLKGLHLEGALPEAEPTLESPLTFESSVTGQLPDSFPGAADELADFSGIPDLGPALDLDAFPPVDAPAAAVAESAPKLPEPSMDFDWVDDREALLKVEPVSAPPSPVPDLIPEPIVPVTPVVAPLPVAAPLVEAAPVAPVAGLTDAKALVEALKADPEALQALAKAVVGQLGDQAIKELAWELMPELADRLGRH